MELDGLIADVAAELDLSEEARVEHHFIDWGEVFTVEGKHADLGDEGGGTKREGFDVEDDGCHGERL